MALRHQFEVSESISRGSSLQNGKHPKPEGCIPSRGLSCQVRFKRCLPVGSNGCPISPPSSFPLEGGYIRVHESPFRLSTSSADIYEVTETSGSFSEESRGAANHLPGRYSLDGIHSDFAEIS